MDEDIRAGVLNDEPKPMPVIEPFYLATGHSFPLPKVECAGQRSDCNKPNAQSVTNNRFWNRLCLKLDLTDKAFGPAGQALHFRGVGRLFDLQGLIEKLGQVGQDGRFADNQGGTRRLRGGLQLRARFRR